MPGINGTGKPNIQDYSLGRGIVYAALLTNNVAGGYRDLGNATAVNVSVETTTIEHTSSRTGTGIVDKEIVTSTKVNLSITLDEINFENLALFFLGDTATPTNAAIAGFAEHEMITGVVLGQWYPIVSAAGARAYNTTNANLTIEEAAGPTTLVLGTDFELEVETGRIFFLTTAVNIANGEDVDVTLAGNAGAGTVDEVKALTKSSTVVAISFISENPSNGAKTIFDFHRVPLRPSGDFSMISDEFSSLTLEGLAETNATADADSPTLTVTYPRLA